MGFLTRCSSRKYPYLPSPPPPPQRAMKIQREGGFQKEAVFEEVGVGLSRSFFLGLQVMIKLSVILLSIGVSKQKLLFSSMIFHLRSAESFFHGLHESLCNMIVISSLINLVIYLLLCYTIYCGINCNVVML